MEVVLEFMADWMHQIIGTEHPDLGKLIAKNVLMCRAVYDAAITRA
jgi:hypothetical protein